MASQTNNLSLNNRTRPKHITLIAIVFVFLKSTIYMQQNHEIVFENVVFFLFLSHLTFKAICILISSTSPNQREKKIDLTCYPFYTILLPMFNEREATVRKLIEGINDIDYPLEKLDVKILLEKEDSQTLQIVQNLSHIAKMNLQILVISDAGPQTKPRALNIGLSQAKGDFVVIFDAEDKMNRHQVKDALMTFLRNEKVSVIQYPLKITNYKRNYLTRIFAAEYFSWFNISLNGLSKLNTIYPLGGTSNHFRVKDLLEVRGWDAYNVTEDLEIGIEYAKRDKLIIFKNIFPTEEECVETVKKWLNQRRRWIKGYIYTYITNIYKISPLKFSKFISLHLFLGMSFLSIITTPYCTYIAIKKGSVVANAIMISFTLLINIIAVKSMLKIDRKTNLIKFIIAYNLSIILHFIATIIAIFDLIKKPYYWHKTPH